MTLITPEYREQQMRMHEMARGYGGVNARTYGGVIMQLVDEHNPQTVLDYGAGKGHIGEFLFKHGFKGDYRPYDPAIPYWSSEPQPAELVCCIDVLEHIEPELLDAVLDDLRRVTVCRGVFTIHHRKAQKTLPDGRNAHLTVQPPEWWAKRLAERFRIVDSVETIGKFDRELLSTLYVVEPMP